MSKKTLLFLRHGKTHYTEIFPDLTDEGIAEIEEAALVINDMVGIDGSCRIVSSPLPRALGTADIIARRCGYLETIHHAHSLRSVDLYDVAAARAIWRSFPSARHVDHAYAIDHQFELGTVVEKRSDVQRRFLVYLGSLIATYAEGGASLKGFADVTIHVSHYEVLWNLVDMFRLEEPLLHGEIIRLDLSQSSREGHVCVMVIFRDKFRRLEIPVPRDLNTWKLV